MRLTNLTRLGLLSFNVSNTIISTDIYLIRDVTMSADHLNFPYDTHAHDNLAKHCVLPIQMFTARHCRNVKLTSICVWAIRSHPKKSRLVVLKSLVRSVIYESN